MLRQLKIRKQIELARAALSALTEEEQALQTRTAQAETAIAEAETDEDMALLEEETAAIETESGELAGRRTALESDIRALEEELAKIGEPTLPETPPAPEDVRNKTVTGGEWRMSENRHETRAQMLERLNRPEVREFYAGLTAKVRGMGGNTGTLANVDLTIPEIVINMIQTRLGDYGILYREVNVVRLSGDARVIMDGAIPEGIWMDCCDPVQELTGAFTQTELNCFMVGGFFPLCNAVLEDSMINLANYVEQRLAWAIAKAVDKAILTGDPAQSMPTGIIPKLTAAHKVTSTGELADIMGNMALLDTGADGPPLGEVIAVMKRATYYSRLMPQTFLPTADGRLVIQSPDGARFPDGTRIVFSQYMPDDTILMGDFKKYLLGERAGIKLESSTHVRFIEGQTVFKGTARYDGEPIYPDMFVQITLDPVTP